MDKIRVLIADHDPVARSVLRTYVQQYPRAEVIGESAVACKTVDTIRRLSPDVVFLELELPGFNGFEILRRLGVNRPPIVVFVAPHKNYAVEAFEVQAFDYVLKPVSQERIIRVLDRAVVQIDRSTLEKFEARLQVLLNELKIPDVRRDNGQCLHRIVIRQNGRVFFLDPTDVDWIEACANYVVVHVGQAKYLLKETMQNLEAKLNGGMFLRVHRSAIVKIRKLGDSRALLLSSLLFGIWHYPVSIILWDAGILRSTLYVLNISLVGILFGYQFLRSNSLLTCSLSHGVWNALAYTLFGFGNTKGLFSGDSKAIYGPEEGIVGTIVLIIFVSFVLLKQRKNLVHRNDSSCALNLREKKGMQS